MGATNCPETPRQRMINMMYLVLTAMLALNVSKDILDAFSVVDETLVTSNKNTESSIASDYSFLDRQKAILGVEKVKDADQKAQQLKKVSNDMIKYINTMKSDLLKYVEKTDLNDEGKTKTAKDITSKDDYTTPTNFFITQGNAVKLKNEILKYKSQILALVPEKDRAVCAKTMGLNVTGDFLNKDGQKESWENHNFDHVIMIACVTLLNKTAGEVRNAESMVLKQIISSISADDFKFDNIQGRAIPKTQMVFSGDSYEADIIVMAYDSKQTPEVYYKMGVDTLTEAQLGGATKLDGVNGLVKLKLGTGGVGDQRYAGLIKVKKPDGTDTYYGFNDKYTVVKPSATVAADKMNVFYAGIPNPVSVSAPVALEKLRLSIPGCTAASVGGGKYNVSVPAGLIGRVVTASVSADLGGKGQALGTTDFRVKRVPDPTSYIGAKIWGGKRSKQELMANPFLTAQMGDDFAYDLRWSITSYRVTFIIRGIEDPPMACSGGQFSEAVKAKINKAGINTVIQFSEIRATSIAGSRNLRDITVRIR
jgi:gliding motility-associated protein GldM